MSSQTDALLSKLSVENVQLRARVAEAERLYEELRAVIDGGSESMTHADALETVRTLGARVAELERVLGFMLNVFRQDGLGDGAEGDAVRAAEEALSKRTASNKDEVRE